jgi:hypothetical protein
MACDDSDTCLASRRYMPYTGRSSIGSLVMGLTEKLNQNRGRTSLCIGSSSGGLQVGAKAVLGPWQCTLCMRVALREFLSVDPTVSLLECVIPCGAACVCVVDAAWEHGFPGCSDHPGPPRGFRTLAPDSETGSLWWVDI